MKKALSIILALSWGTPSFANKLYEFRFQYPTQAREFTISITAPEQEFEVAFEKASLECYHHFKSKNQTIGEEETLDLADTCANPNVSSSK